MFGINSGTTTQSTSTQLSLPQLVEVLISTGIIQGDKVEFARNAVENSAESSPDQAQTPAAPTPAGFQFTRDLQLNDTGREVIALQQFLNNRNYTVNPNQGEEGSLGNETAFFGELTRQALIKYQQDNNITPADGTFGQSTRVVANPTIR